MNHSVRELGSVQDQSGDSSSKRSETIMLAFLDILGFSNRVQRLGPDAVYAEYIDLLNAIEQSVQIRSSIVPIPVGGDRLGLVGCGGFKLHHAIFSDSILLWTNYGLPNVEPFLDRVTELFCEALLRNIPLRGCVTFGEAVMDNERDIYLGNPIIEAAQGEASQSWLGVSFGPSVSAGFEWLGSLRHVIPYKIPSKSTSPADAPSVALDWPRRWRERYSSATGTDAVAKLTQLNTDLRFSRYYDSGTEFARYSEQNSNWWDTVDWQSVAFVGHDASEPYAR